MENTLAQLKAKLKNSNYTTLAYYIGIDSLFFIIKGIKNSASGATKDICKQPLKLHQKPQKKSETK